jgi:hypothetical protein
MPDAASQICQLQHSGFRLLGEPVFRLSEGSCVPSMVVQLDHHDAVLPLRSVAREFHIEPASDDGRMLDLIERALEYVVALRLGDRLPSELNGGEASWKPTEQDSKVAARRVKRELIRCVFARLGRRVAIVSETQPDWDDLHANRVLLQQATQAAAAQLGGVEPGEVTDRVGKISAELACIETMRRLLTRGLAAPQEKLLRYHVNDVPASRRDTFQQVQGLARRGLKQITSRFDGIDARLDDILSMLRDVAETTSWLRNQRDWLYRTNHAWEPVFAEWARASGHIDEFLWKVVEKTYLFLAPRFMSFQEWTMSEAREAKPVLRARVW